jgi:hypothetical protein
MLQRSRKISKNTRPLKLPTSVKKAAAELAATGGVSRAMTLIDGIWGNNQ